MATADHLSIYLFTIHLSIYPRPNYSILYTSIHPLSLSIYIYTYVLTSGRPSFIYTKRPESSPMVDIDIVSRGCVVVVAAGVVFVVAVVGVVVVVVVAVVVVAVAVADAVVIVVVVVVIAVVVAVVLLLLLLYPVETTQLGLTWTRICQLIVTTKTQSA